MFDHDDSVAIFRVFGVPDHTLCEMILPSISVVWGYWVYVTPSDCVLWLGYNTLHNQQSAGVGQPFAHS